MTIKLLNNPLISRTLNRLILTNKNNSKKLSLLHNRLTRMVNNTQNHSFATSTRNNRFNNSELHNAYEILDLTYPNEHSGLLITVEHATTNLPPEYDWSEHDENTHVGKHWSYDIASADAAKELANLTGSITLLCRFNRLFCDANRPIGSDTMFRRMCDNNVVQLNKDIDINNNHERNKRIDSYYKPYHNALHKLATTNRFNVALSLHSYTDNYESNKRDVEIGILYKNKKDEQLAKNIQQLYKQHSYDCRINEPWSGKDGFMYAVDQISNNVGNTIMIEYRNDLLSQQHWRNDVLNILTRYLIEQNYIKICKKLDNNQNNDKTIRLTDLMNLYCHDIMLNR